ncbi:MAG: response regulator [Planctomycetota bacterium]
MTRTQRTALVAEDNSALLRVIAFTLRKEGFVVTTASNGEAAWDVARSDTFDLIVTDYQMPRLNGLELVDRLREDERFATTPVVLLTAKGLELDADRLREEYGVAAVLIKPFSPTELGQLVSRLSVQPV